MLIAENYNNVWDLVEMKMPKLEELPFIKLRSADTTPRSHHRLTSKSPDVEVLEKTPRAKAAGAIVI